MQQKIFFYTIPLFFFFCILKPQALVNVQKIIPSIEIDLKYASADNFVHKKVYDFDTCYLLEHVCLALKKVQEDLADLGLGLKIFDGFRPLQAQFKFWEICPDPRYVSNPHTEMGRHTRGTAVDLTLINLKTGAELEMPTAFDDFTSQAAPDYKYASANAIKNRTLLQRTMNKRGFTNNKTEWWHFDYKDWQNFQPLRNVVINGEDRIEC